LLSTLAIVAVGTTRPIDLNVSIKVNEYRFTTQRCLPRKGDLLLERFRFFLTSRNFTSDSLLDEDARLRFFDLRFLDGFLCRFSSASLELNDKAWIKMLKLNKTLSDER
jgi:hypothetical protein